LVKDIDLVLVPRYIDQTTVDLFGGKAQTKVVSPNFTDQLKQIGKIVKGKPDGRQLQLSLEPKFKGYKLDLFMPDPVDFYRILAIRTGSVQYIQTAVGPRWRQMGWCGTDHGLRRREDCKLITTTSGKRWELVKHNGLRPPAWESEKHFFEWLKLEYIQPEQRM
jgi:DNA polymerase/3'-5' exonuclease PolX